jgi:hypothetical protein
MALLPLLLAAVSAAASPAAQAPAWPSAQAALASPAALPATRLALEQPGDVDVAIPAHAQLSSPARCLLDRKPSVGWPGYTRPNSSKRTTDGVGCPATLVNPTTVRCHLANAEWPLLTGGNASLTVDGINGTAKGASLPGGRAVELFALFEPQWGRRPYLREAEGALVLALDASLAQAGALHVTATLPGGAKIDASVSAGCTVRVPFTLAGVPVAVDELVQITLTAADSKRFPPITKGRRFIRHPPPPANATFVSWQVDHERGGGLLADGVSTQAIRCL